LEQAGLAPLAQAGLDSTKFRLSDEEVAGTVQGNRKDFLVAVRVIDPNVNQIPALSYSWFDPIQEKYMTTQSEPRSLTVGRAKIVSSADVVSSQTSSADDVSETPARSESATAAQTEKTIRSFAGADLAIERDSSKLLAGSRSERNWLDPLCYFAGAIVVGLAVLDKVRLQWQDREVSPTRRTARHVTRIRRAPATADGARDIADALRDVAGNLQPRSRQTLDEIVGRLETIIYSPHGPDGSRIEQLRRQAIDVLEGISRGST
jgi:hypothetical protein